MNKHETWAQGAKPGDLPLMVVTKPIPPEQIEQTARRKRLRAVLDGSLTASEVQQALEDIVTELGLPT